MDSGCTAAGHCDPATARDRADDADVRRPGGAGEERTAPAQRRQGAPPISAAQRRVLVALAARSAREASRFRRRTAGAAAALSLSVETVKFHLHALFEAFGIADVPQHQKRAALARLALEQGVVSPHEPLRDSG